MPHNQTIERPTEQPTVGLLGYGDLGRRLAMQALWSGYNVLVYDPMVPADLPSGEPLDPNMRKPTAGIIGKLTVVHCAQAVLDASSVVHWAVSSRHLPSLPEVSADKIVILHDSVMHTSVQAVRKRTDAARFAIAHCLTNPEKRVFVLDDRHAQTIYEHFESLGLSPKVISAKDHDKLMARTQGPLALLINAGLREYLARQEALGNLTPSGKHQKDALDDRAARWTKETIDSILRNPELPEVTLYIAAKLLSETVTPTHAITVARRLGTDLFYAARKRLGGTSYRFFNGQ